MANSLWPTQITLCGPWTRNVGNISMLRSRKDGIWGRHWAVRSPEPVEGIVAIPLILDFLPSPPKRRAVGAFYCIIVRVPMREAAGLGDLGNGI